MVAVSRVLDAQVFGEETTAGTEASSYNINIFGDVVNCSLKTTEDNKVINGTTGGTTTGHLPSKIVNLKATPTGTITFHPHTFEFYKYVISDFTSDASSYTLANRSTDLCDSLSIKGTYDGTKGIRHLGCYLNNIRFSVTDGNIITVTADIVSLFSDTFTGAVSYTAPSGSPLTYVDGVFTFAGNTWDLQSLNCGFNPKHTQKWGINDKTTNKKRYPTDIYRGGKVGITFDGVANIEDIDDELITMQGGSSVADTKSNSTITITCTDNDSNTHTITMSGQTTESEIIQTDSEESNKTVTFRGDATDFSVAGTY